jgi:hypothetical protein
LGEKRKNSRDAFKAVFYLWRYTYVLFLSGHNHNGSSWHWSRNVCDRKTQGFGQLGNGQDAVNAPDGMCAESAENMESSSSILKKALWRENKIMKGVRSALKKVLIKKEGKRMRLTVVNSFLLDNQGDMYISLIISIIAIFAVFATFLFIYPMFTAQQALNSEARLLISVAEEHGQIGTAVDDAQTMIEEKTGFPADTVEWDAVWLNESARTVQLNDPITVTLTKAVSIPIFNVTADGKSLISVTVRASASGASQEYFKS